VRAEAAAAVARAEVEAVIEPMTARVIGEMTRQENKR
jgi:hypothetical protein